MAAIHILVCLVLEPIANFMCSMNRGIVLYEYTAWNPTRRELVIKNFEIGVGGVSVPLRLRIPIHHIQF